MGNFKTKNWLDENFPEFNYLESFRNHFSLGIIGNYFIVLFSSVKKKLYTFVNFIIHCC